jgi:single-strand DNA-binding protein
MNKIIICGRLGKDATVNNVNGKNVINFSVVTSERWKDSTGEMREKSTWFDVSRWSDNTNVAQYLTKGSQVIVEGSVDVRTYNGADGTTKASLSIKATNIELVGGKPAESVKAEVVSDGINNDDSDSLPF